MSSNHRITRPTPARTAPIRSVSALFGSPVSAGGEAAAGGPPGGGQAEAWNDVVSRSVELGYRVIDDYVRQGERMARAMSDRGAGPQEALAGDPQELARRFTQYAMDFTTVWLQLLQSASAGMTTAGVAPFAVFGFPPAGMWPPASPPSAPPAAPAAPPDAAPSATAGATIAPTRVHVAIEAAAPVEVVLDLKPEAATRRLAVQSLRSPDPSQPRLSEVSIGRAGIDEGYVLRVRVPAGHPAGVYNGVVIDEDSALPLGTVSLRVGSE